MGSSELLKPSEIGREVYDSNGNGVDKRFSIVGKPGENNGFVAGVAEVAKKTKPSDRFRRREMQDWNGGRLVYFRRQSE